MIEGLIQRGDSVRHIRSGRIYMVQFASGTVGATVTATDGTTTDAVMRANNQETLVKVDVENDEAPWLPAVVYRNPAEPHRVFVRNEASFREKFERA